MSHTGQSESHSHQKLTVWKKCSSPPAAADEVDSERCEQMTNFASHCFVDYTALLLFRFKLFWDDCGIYVNSAEAEHRGLGRWMMIHSQVNSFVSWPAAGSDVSVANLRAKVAVKQQIWNLDAAAWRNCIVVIERTNHRLKGEMLWVFISRWAATKWQILKMI